jgi:hypothetical protein
VSDLVDRLRGKYVIPIRDGAGPLNGKDTFTRGFQTPPIHHEAAARIESLEKAARAEPKTFAKWWKGYATRTLLSFPWVRDVARDAFQAGRRSASIDSTTTKKP